MRELGGTHLGTVPFHKVLFDWTVLNIRWDQRLLCIVLFLFEHYCHMSEYTMSIATIPRSHFHLKKGTNLFRPVCFGYNTTHHSFQIHYLDTFGQSLLNNLSKSYYVDNLGLLCWVRYIQRHHKQVQDYYNSEYVFAVQSHNIHCMKSMVASLNNHH